MDKKTTGIVAYITLIGWIVAYCAGDKEGAKFHLNQALILWIMTLINMIIDYIPFIGLIQWVLSIFILACWIIGLVNACKEVEKPLPLIGNITILK